MDEVPLSSLLGRGLAVAGLIAANALFVAAEYSLLTARRARLDARASQGDSKAKLARKAIQSLDRHIAGAQLGVTLATIGLVWIAEPPVAALMQRAFRGLPEPLDLLSSHAFAIAVTFLALATVHMVFGRVIPRAVALSHPVDTSRWVTGPVVAFTAIANPFLSLLHGTASRILRLVNLRAPSEAERTSHPDEILSMVRQSQQSGHFDTQDVQLIKGVLEFTEKAAREVMTPRTEVIALEATLTVEEAAARVAEAGRSRYPVIRDSLDDIAGIVHVKQILAKLPGAKYQRLDGIMQEAFFVPSSREIEDLLTDMQRLKRHMAIVLDEYGGTAGIVTMEDLLEEIVGEIHDEYDEGESQLQPAEAATTLPGSMEIAEANERFDFGIASDHYTTVGGYVFGTLGRLPKVGDRVLVENAVLEVTEMDERRVGGLRIRPRGAD